MNSFKFLIPFLFVTLTIGAFAQAGSLDPSFNGTGKLISSISDGDDMANALVVQPDGKIVVAGTRNNGSNNDFMLARYNPDGSFDTGFGTSGIVSTDFDSTDDVVNAMILQPDGKIVVAGYASNGIETDVGVVRYNADGSLDQTFGMGGGVVTAVGTGPDVVTSLTLQPDGKIVAAGFTFNGLNNDMMILRYTTNGTPDSTFNSFGRVVTDINNADNQADAVVLQSDGRIVIAGNWFRGGAHHFAVLRYESDGRVDTSFNHSGKFLYDISTYDDRARAISVLPDGKILVAGYAYMEPGLDYALLRLTTDGRPDSTFGENGIRITDFRVTSNDDATAIAVQSNGRIILAGTSLDSSGYNFALARYTAEGKPDSTFGRYGRATASFQLIGDYCTAAALQSDGKIVLAGYSFNGITNDVALARFLTEPDAALRDRITDATTMNIYPNPVSTTLSVQLDKPATLTLWDIFGNQVAQWNGAAGVNRFDVSGYASGMYVVRNVRTGEYTSVWVIR